MGRLSCGRTSPCDTEWQPLNAPNDEKPPVNSFARIVRFRLDAAVQCRQSDGDRDRSHADLEGR
jgi:hypothetical protein